MHIEPIFVDPGATIGLHSICFRKKSEFADYYERLKDAVYVRDFCNEYIDKKKKAFYGKSMEEIIKDVLAESASIFSLLLTQYKHLDDFFKPLSKHPDEYNLSKLKLNEEQNPKSKIRIYAVRLAENTYIFTGGAIKISEKISQHPDTARERKKMIRVRDWLVQQTIVKEEDLIFYYAEQ